MKDVIQNINVTSLLVLPIYNSIFITSKKYDREPLLFQVLCLRYGLINSFILNKKGEFDGSIKLLFDKERVTSVEKESSGPYYSLNERLIDSKLLKSVRIVRNKLMYELMIPEKYHNDIKLIIDSKYSQVSDEYKELLYVNSKLITASENEIYDYIYSHRIAYHIVKAPSIIVKKFAEEISAIVPDNISDLEGFEKFDINKNKLLINE